MERKLYSYTAAVLILAGIIYILINPFAAAYFAREGVKVCAYSLVPSLFTFMVLTRILSHFCAMGIFDGKLTRLISDLFNLPSCVIPICLVGLLCGSPSGAFAICRLYDNGFCTKEEAERACILTGNCSAAFLLGFVSAQLGSKTAGIYIFFASMLALLTVYFLLFRNGTSSKKAKANQNSPHPSFTEIVSESISSSATSTAVLCGYVILFYTFTQILCEKLTALVTFFVSGNSRVLFTNAAVGSFFEISLGVIKSAMAGGNLSAVLCAGAAGFTGLSIIFQTASVLTKSGISIKNYIFSRCLCALLCPIIYILEILILPATVDVFSSSNNPPTVTVNHIAVLFLATSAVFAGSYLLSYLDKKHKK